MVSRNEAARVLAAHQAEVNPLDAIARRRG